MQKEESAKVKPGGSELPLARRVVNVLKASRVTVAVAEGATGGRIGERLTRYPGSSAFFLGGVVTYDYPSRTRLLGVASGLLQEHGAVSEQAAKAMAEGVRQLFGSDIGLASTGIAGPGGGTPEKPVGLLWTAVATAQATAARPHLVSGATRLSAQRRFTALALQFLLERVEIEVRTLVNRYTGGSQRPGM